MPASVSLALALIGVVGIGIGLDARAKDTLLGLGISFGAGSPNLIEAEGIAGGSLAAAELVPELGVAQLALNNGFEDEVRRVVLQGFAEREGG